MPPEQVVAAVQAWQRDMSTHRLTCARDASHRVLEPVLAGQHVSLVCPDCGYSKRRIPELVLRAYERALAATVGR